MKPDKIILWLGEDKFPGGKLPEIFDKVKKCGVNIEFREDIGPHTKYFHAMKEYPDDIVITFDDDQIYNRDVIEVLYRSYIEHPDTVQCINVNEVVFTSEWEVASYENWKRFEVLSGHSSHAYVPLGVGGALYPPHSVSDEVFNIEAIRKLCPKNDDIWIKFMLLLKGTKITRVGYKGKTNIYEGPSYTIFRSQEGGLWKENGFEGGNDRQFKAMLDAYNSYLPGKTLLEIMREDSTV